MRSIGSNRACPLPELGITDMATTQNTLRRRRTDQRSARGGDSDASSNEHFENAQISQSNHSEQSSQSNPADRAAQNNTSATRGALRQVIIRFIFMYAVYYLYLKPKQKKSFPAPQPDPESVSPGLTPVPSVNPLFEKLGLAQTPSPQYYNKRLTLRWKPGTSFDARVYITPNASLTFRGAVELPPSEAAWKLDRLTYATEDTNYRSQNISVDVPAVVRSYNTSWFAHVFVGKSSLWDIDLGAVSDDEIEDSVLYYRHEITFWVDASEIKEGKNLLGNDNDDNVLESTGGKEGTCKEGICEAENNIDAENDSTGVGETVDKDVGYRQKWKPTLPIVLVVGTDELVLAQLPPTAANLFRVSKLQKWYYPPMHVDEFWQLRDSLLDMNDTVSSVVLQATFTPIGLYKWSLYRQFDNVWQRQLELGAIGPKEVDEVKRMFVETNPILLITTFIVSIAHTVLETLAFKNDISHWRNIKSFEGVSVRSMIWRIAMEAIIFLYLWDNDTSWMIVVGNFVGLLIEVWKLCKAVKFEKFGEGRLFWIIPWFKMSDRESYSRKTKEYDDQAMKYLSYVMYPLVVGYAIYSLWYQKHRSWYSWMINSLVGAVYAFGFLGMFPQVFINYKLKSVAHIPLKAMMYKTLNTVIDDLFSFIIKMPLLHRLACFRDDIVFLIILYQRWIYPVDYSLVNEYGQQFDEHGQQIIHSAVPRTEDNGGEQSSVTTPTGIDETEAENSVSDSNATDTKENGYPAAIGIEKEANTADDTAGETVAEKEIESPEPAR